MEIPRCPSGPVRLRSCPSDNVWTFTLLECPCCAPAATATQRGALRYLAQLVKARSLQRGAFEQTSRRNRLALVGLRGAGKCSLRRRLAADLKIPFIELADIIEQTAGVQLSEVGRSSSKYPAEPTHSARLACSCGWQLTRHSSLGETAIVRRQLKNYRHWKKYRCFHWHLSFNSILLTQDKVLSSPLRNMLYIACNVL